MARTLEFLFDDLPLVIQDGFEAGLVSGSADIEYAADGQWFVSTIALDGYRERTREERQVIQAGGGRPSFFERKPVAIHGADPTGAIIYYRLTHEWRSLVQDAVCEAIAADDESEADDYGDYRRDFRKSEVA